MRGRRHRLAPALPREELCDRHLVVHAATFRKGTLGTFVVRETHRDWSWREIYPSPESLIRVSPAGEAHRQSSHDNLNMIHVFVDCRRPAEAPSTWMSLSRPISIHWPRQYAEVSQIRRQQRIFPELKMKDSQLDRTEDVNYKQRQSGPTPTVEPGRQESQALVKIPPGRSGE